MPICSDYPIVTSLPNGTAEGASGDIGICISHRKQEPFSETLHRTVTENHLSKTALIIVGDCLGDHYERSRLYAPDFSTEFREAST